VGDLEDRGALTATPQFAFFNLHFSIFNHRAGVAKKLQALPIENCKLQIAK